MQPCVCVLKDLQISINSSQPNFEFLLSSNIFTRPLKNIFGVVLHFLPSLLYGSAIFSFPATIMEFLYHRLMSAIGVSHSESKSHGLIPNLTILHQDSIIKEGEIHHGRRTETNFSTSSIPKRLMQYSHVSC